MEVALDEGAFTPVRALEGDVGYDLFTPRPFLVPAHGYATVDTGVHIKLPPDTRGHVCSKSGLNRYRGITTDGTVDPNYRGSIGVTLHNSGDEDVLFDTGQKIAQIVIEPILRPDVVIVDHLDNDTDRGSNGFGSTGA